ncbi:putative E3 ubiquitin-protein ligase RING1a [Tripterygium wilfordii]|uniref:Putative E3 ubiquitin-protein ligase RING1a n=1 Tax=Tripterygium wilfordii TaxID=458696 RepID=A0A7J7CEL3_TRIWF|nr:putative E3 ubiquitin-protein ligase RING1a [Tripterygium wilfordii]KAF5732579.1 putative E3 ubiquitin-protein ligase RING1a [Tripterygium wilfordii]
MPAHKRPLPPDNPSNGDPVQENHHQHSKQEQPEDPELEEKPQEREVEEEEEEGEADRVEELEEEGAESEAEGESSSSEEKPEFVYVELPEIRKDVQCPICLGIIRKTRTVMECLHRFCRECIDKSMRLGNNECPACRTHCASRRSLRDDPNFDALIAALYPDIDKYEEQEFAFQEEDKNRNKQIQASIAEIFQRQSEALVRKRPLGKETGGPLMTRPQRSTRTLFSRRRRNTRGVEPQASEDNEDGNDDNGGKDSSSADEHSVELRPPRRCKRRTALRPFHPTSSAIKPDGGGAENDLVGNTEKRGPSPGLVWNTEMLAWGRGGLRSNTRHGVAGGGNNRNSQSTRLSKLVEHIQGAEENDDELNVHLMLVSLDKQSMPSLQRPYLCCRPSVSVKQLCDYVTLRTELQSEEVEILLKGHPSDGENRSTPNPSSSIDDEMKVLEDKDTLAKIKDKWPYSRHGLVLMYRQKANS